MHYRAPDTPQIFQRDIAGKADTRLSRQYGSLSPETKLAFWYLLAQGMESGTIIPMPPNYELPQLR